MKRSNFLSLNMSDAIKGLFLAAITALISGVYQLISTGTLFTWENIKPMLLTVLATVLSYIIKNFLTNSQGEPLRTENSELVKFVKRGNPLPKILLIGLILSGIGITASAQNRWSGFFQPASNNLSFMKGSGEKSYEFKFRPAAEMTAIQMLYDKESKEWTSSTFHSAGLGLGLQHYVQGQNGPVNNYGFNALLMLDATPVEGKGAGFGIAATMNVPNFVNFGGGYNLTFKQWYLLLGAVYNF